MDRRGFLRTGLTVAAGGVAGGCDGARPAAARFADLFGGSGSGGTGDWNDVRAAFDLAPGVVHMSALYVSSHPRPVREAIERHRRELDRNPVEYLDAQNRPRMEAARAAAAAYLGTDAAEIALTDSTTMGLGLVYTGLQLPRGSEILTTEHDYFVTHEALRLTADRTGARVRRVRQYDRPANASTEDIVDRTIRAIRPATRVLAVTWVHSGTGVKLPLEQLGAALAQVNARRAEQNRVLLAVDAVHGFGVEDVTVGDLRCDFLVSGCHKWLFGPRGTGIVWGRGAAWRRLRPVIPSFLDPEPWRAWFEAQTPRGPTTAARMTPGGFKPFEHQWAVTEAFEFHQDIGKDQVQRRTHALAHQLKEGLGAMEHVTLHTPLATEVSSGIVCFEVGGMSAQQAVDALRRRDIVATVTPYPARYVRLTPSIRNTPGEVDAVLRAVRELT